MNNDRQPNALQSQILAAEREINDAQQTVTAQKSVRHARWGTPSQIIAVIVVVSFVGVLVWQQRQLRYWLIGPSPQTMQVDLEALMAQAAQDVNDYHDRTGNWPAHLSNPALAALVNYQYHGNARYTLSARHSQITLEQSY